MKKHELFCTSNRDDIIVNETKCKDHFNSKIHGCFALSTTKIAISKLQGCLLNCDFSSVTRTIDVEEKDKTT